MQILEDLCTILGASNHSEGHDRQEKEGQDTCEQRKGTSSLPHLSLEASMNGSHRNRIMVLT